MATANPMPEQNAKGELIAACRNLGLPDPRFESESGGPGHAPHFRCTVTVGEREVGQGEGRSKRDAERAASLEALRAIEALAVPSDRRDVPQALRRWPIYADVLSQALLVAHERRGDGTLPQVAQDAALIYRQVLSDLGYAPEAE
ncbi:double-stranded RNA binding motif domain-containing protein [Deinococcus sp.]|uniref:double-stranded RNA binding motif domain-containing protein n=1 Tax=Deinococcus sp. TaxID=47478 RepID=UPI003C7B044A